MSDPTGRWSFPSRIVPLSKWPAVVRGRWTPAFNAIRGDFPANVRAPFVLYAYLDGEPVTWTYGVAEADRDWDGKGGSRWSPVIDSTRWADGPHTLRIYGYPAEPEPGAPQRWHAAYERTVAFENGAVPMALLPSAEQCVVPDATPLQVTGRILHCDGTLHPLAGPLALATERADRVRIDGDTLAVLDDGWATVTATDPRTRLSAPIRVGRYPAGLAALPNLGSFVIAPFYQSVADDGRDPRLAAAHRAARLTTYWYHVGPNVGTMTRAQYAESFERFTADMWPFLDAHPEADVVLVFDAIGRTRPEARASLDNPDAEAAYLWALAQWQARTRGRVREVRVIDEATWYGDTPTPMDRRWDHFTGVTRIASANGPRVRAGSRDFSFLPRVAAPADGSAQADRRPRFHIRSGAHAGRWGRVARGGPRGELELATDAAALATGFDPRTMPLAPGDTFVVGGWYSDPAVPLPDDTFARLAAILRKSGVPFGFATAAHAPGPVIARWVAIGTVANVYSHVAPAYDFPPLPTGHTLPQGRIGHDFDWHSAQDHADLALPWLGIVPATGPFYTKRSNRRVADFDPAVDVSHGGAGRAIWTALHLALRLIDGACGVAPYFHDTAEGRATRAAETYPRTKLPEPLQTGFHPAAKGLGGAIFRVLASFRRLLDTLGPEVFHPLGIAPALGPGLRASRRGELLLVLNTRDARTRTVPIVGDGPVRRHRLVGERLTAEELRAGTETRLVIEPGELTVLDGAVRLSG